MTYSQILYVDKYMIDLGEFVQLHALIF